MKAHYEINVSFKGQHFFATDSTYRIYEPSEVKKVVDMFRKVFPEEMGYAYSIVRRVQRDQCVSCGATKKWSSLNGYVTDAFLEQLIEEEKKEQKKR